MIVTLQTQRVRTLEQVRRVAEGNEPVDFTLADRASAYEFIRRTLAQFDCSPQAVVTSPSACVVETLVKDERSHGAGGTVQPLSLLDPNAAERLQAAHSTDNTSACSSTVRVAFSCLSGG